MPLDRYRAKRDFGRTPEPAPGIDLDGTPGPVMGTGQPPRTDAPGGCGRFVVHRHRAGRLHYDLRLEIDGVLASWALPKGPTRDPDERRFAARTEDHPIEYLDFEGVIPKGEYGAGDSICWDWGTFEPELTWDPGEAVRAGELKFRLRGEKLAGRFTLVRTGDGNKGGRGSAGDDEGAAWLLIAKAGPDAVPGWDPEDFPASVKTDRTNDEVAADVPPRAERPAPAPLPSLDPAGSRPRRPASVRRADAGDTGERAVRRRRLALRAQVGRLPGPGDRGGGKVELRTRNRHDAGRYFPELLGPPTWLAAPEAIVDGEVVALDDDGRPDFGLLQARLGGGFSSSDLPASPEAKAAGKRAPLVFMAFDLPWCAGRSYVDVPLEERKEILRLVLREHSRVRYAGHVARDGVAFFAAAAAQGLEGAMAKHRLSRYEAGRRSTAWLKLKVRPTQELVVGGYVPGQGSHRDLGALVVGVMEDGRLRYAGRVGSGLDAATRARLRAALDARSRPDHPFDDAPPDLAATADATWATPDLVIRAEIGGWSRDGIVRQATFAQEAPDVDPASVERQVAVGPEAAARALAKAGVGPARRAAATHPVSKPNGSRSSKDEAGRDAGPPAAPPVEPPTEDELAALEALPGRGGTWRVGGRDVTLTNLDKVLAPGVPEGDDPPVTKRDLVRYMTLVAPVMLPHLAGRALNLARYPNGIDGAFFWQKDVAKGTPDWVTRWREPDPPDRRPHAYVVADGIATLAWLGNQAALELHPWTSMLHAPAEPRWALVDIDPGPRTTLGGDARPRPALPAGVRPPRRHRRSEGHRQARHPGVHPDPARVRVRRDAGMGRAGLPRSRRGGARPRELGVVQGSPRRAGAPGLHPELAQPHARRPVLGAAGAGASRLRPDRLGRAGRSRPAARPLDHSDDPGPGGRPR